MKIKTLVEIGDAVLGGTYEAVVSQDRTTAAFFTNSCGVWFAYNNSTMPNQFEIQPDDKPADEPAAVKVFDLLGGEPESVLVKFRERKP